VPESIQPEPPVKKGADSMERRAGAVASPSALSTSWIKLYTTAQLITEYQKNTLLRRFIGDALEEAFETPKFFKNGAYDKTYNKKINLFMDNYQFLHKFVDACVYEQLMGLGFLYFRNKKDPSTPLQGGGEVTGIYALNPDECIPVRPPYSKTPKNDYRDRPAETLKEIQETADFTYTISLSTQTEGFAYTINDKNVHPTRIYIFARDRNIPIRQLSLGDRLIHPTSVLMKAGVSLDRYIVTNWIPTRFLSMPAISMDDQDEADLYLQNTSIEGKNFRAVVNPDEYRMETHQCAPVDTKVLDVIYELIAFSTGITREGMANKTGHETEWVYYINKFQTYYHSYFHKILQTLARLSSFSFPDDIEIQFPISEIKKFLAESPMLEKLARALGVLSNLITVNEALNMLGFPRKSGGDVVLPIYLAQQQAKYENARLPHKNDGKEAGIKTGSPASPEKPPEVKKSDNN